MSNSDLKSDARGLVLDCPQCGRANRLAYQRLGHEFRCGSCQTALPAPERPVEISDAGSFSLLIAQKALPVLADFWAPWCGPCKMVAPELVKVAQNGAGRWLVAKVNTEDHPELASHFAISSIPTLILFREGRETGRRSGALPAMAILRFIQEST